MRKPHAVCYLTVRVHCAPHAVQVQILKERPKRSVWIRHVKRLEQLQLVEQMLAVVCRDRLRRVSGRHSGGVVYLVCFQPVRVAEQQVPVGAVVFPLAVFPLT